MNMRGMAATPIQPARGLTTYPRKLLPIQENIRSLLTWLMMALILTAIGWSLLLAVLDNKKREAEQEALREAASLSRSYARHLDRAIEAIDQILLHVKYEWELSRGALALERIAARGLFPPASDFNVAIIDQHGRLVTGTGPHTQGIMVADQPLFQVHKQSALDFLYIAEPSRHGNDAHVIHFSRKLRTLDGRFLGVVMVSVVADYFTSSYDEATLGKEGFVGMVGADRVVGPVRIGDTTFPAGSRALLLAPHFIFKSGSELVKGGQWFADRRNRYVGWQTLDAYPMIALVGLNQMTVLARYQAARELFIRYAILATLAVFSAALVAMGFSVQLAVRRHQLELTQEAYRMATEEGIEGFYIVRPVRDRSGAILDFMVIDCNSRGAELLKLRRDELIGKSISVLIQKLGADRLISSLHTAMTAGACEGELKSSATEAIAEQWLRLKIVRSNDTLAIRLSDISDTKAHVAELERRGNEDALTGLPNRHWANFYLPQAIDLAAANQTKLAILFIDLDGFKAVNDTMGHEAGDELLRHAGRRLKLAVRPRDHVVRIGGDEFIVIIENIAHKSDAAHVAERVVHAFRKAFSLPQGVQSVGTSIGISVFPDDGTDANILLRNADIAMYSVKTSGKRNYRFFDTQFYEALRARLERETELRYAIEHDQFVMHYQPRVDISTGTTSSMEALVRWVHPAKGLISPLDFIPLAEETGVIIELGALVIDKVCAQLARWSRTGQGLVPVSVNVSPCQFGQVDIVRILKRSLARHGVNPKLIEIELTESSMMGDSIDVARILNEVRALGVKLLVDDFGTGYSSLSQLQQLDFDVLKVDQAFTARLERNEEGQVFFRAIITMAHALGMRVVAEGVETLEQIKLLKTLQCDEIQGFYISHPVPPSETQPILPKWFFPSTA